MRLAWPSQWLISASCTDFHMPRSTEPSSWVAAVTRSGTITIVTSSAMVRPLMPVRADSEPLKARPGTATGRRLGRLDVEAAGRDRLQIGGELVDVDLGLDLHLGGGAVDGVGDAAEGDAGEHLGLVVAVGDG